MGYALGSVLVAFGLVGSYAAFLHHNLLYWPVGPQGLLVGLLAVASLLLLHDGTHALRDAYNAYLMDSRDMLWRGP